MGRKIMAVILQPVYDAEGKLLHQPGEQLAEGHKVLESIPADTYRYVVVEDPPADKDSKDSKDDPEPAPEPTPKAESKGKTEAKSEAKSGYSRTSSAS